jgi:thiol-disulfide isomerase/thioredoxin
MATDPDKGGRNRPNARARAAQLREQQRKQEARRRFLLIGGVVALVVIVVGVMVGIYATKSDKKVTASSAAPAAAVAQVTGIPASDLAKGDATKVTTLPAKVSGPALTFDSKPGLLYFGAEYCPFCAAERWPLVVAMSRFGTWSNLKQTFSGAAPEPFPQTPTFSFVGARFSSQYLGFSSVETETNQLVNGNYTKLQTPTSQQTELLTKYDTKGSIPFVDYGNKFVTIGASYDPTVLKGKSFDEIAAAVADPSSAIGKSVLGAAKVFTAAICETTGGKPASVCDLTDIKKLRGTLNAQ